MDPFSIVTGCIGLVATIGQVSLAITTFVRGTREARSDMDAVSRELSSLSTVLALIAEDAKDPHKPPFPQSLEKHISSIVENCGAVVLDINALLKKYEGGGGGGGSLRKNVSWSLHGKDDAARLRSSLEAHKAALELGLDVLSLTLTKEIKHDTTEIRNDAAAIKDDTALILEEIHRLQDKLSNAKTSRSDFVLERYLEDMTSYTEATLEEEEEEEEEEHKPGADGWKGGHEGGAFEYGKSGTGAGAVGDACVMPLGGVMNPEQGGHHGTGVLPQAYSYVPPSPYGTYDSGQPASYRPSVEHKPNPLPDVNVFPREGQASFPETRPCPLPAARVRPGGQEQVSMPELFEGPGISSNPIPKPSPGPASNTYRAWHPSMSLSLSSSSGHHGSAAAAAAPGPRADAERRPELLPAVRNVSGPQLGLPTLVDDDDRDSPLLPLVRNISGTQLGLPTIVDDDRAEGYSVPTTAYAHGSRQGGGRVL